MEITPSKAQIKAIDSLIDGSLTPETIHSRTYEVLVREGWVTEEGIVSQAGLTHTTYPTVPVDVAVFGKPVTYTHQQYPEGTSKSDIVTGKAQLERVTLTFPKGTELLITWVHGNKHQQAFEGMINVKGKPMWVRIYKAPHMKMTKRLMPDRKAVENGTNRSTRND